MYETINTTVAKYGWTVTEQDEHTFMLFNRNSRKVTIVHLKPRNSYMIEDTYGNKLLTGKGKLEQSIEKLLTTYFYASLIN